MPNNLKIKRNRGCKNFGIYAQMLRAKPKIIRDRICKKSRRKRMEKQKLSSLVDLFKELTQDISYGASRDHRSTISPIDAIVAPMRKINDLMGRMDMRIRNAKEK